MTIVITAQASSYDYEDLQADIAAYLHRTDLASRIPTFIALAEAVLFREINVKDLQTTATLTTTGEYAPLPADFGSLSKIEVTVNGLTYPLDYQSQPETSTGTVYPSKFAFENGQIRIFGAGTGTTGTLYYTPKIDPLSSTNLTNWLLDNARDLYLYASAMEGAKYIRDDAQAAALTGYVSGAMDTVKKFSERKGQPLTASLQIKVRR